VDLHAYIWVRFEGEVQTGKGDNELEKEETLVDGSVWKYYQGRKVRETADGEQIAQYVHTTPGRIIYNKTILDALDFDLVH
jgi:DNA-directed RNA polymerase subunit beta'